MRRCVRPRLAVNDGDHDPGGARPTGHQTGAQSCARRGVMSDSLGDFMRYARAFQEAYATDDWARVEILFDDDIVWGAGGPGLPPGTGYLARGRSNASAAVKKSCDMYDRRFDRREPIPTSGPVAIPGGVHLEWVVTYTREGLPPIVVRGEEWDLFRD